MATFVCIGNRGINLDLVTEWNYTPNANPDSPDLWVYFGDQGRTKFKGQDAHILHAHLTMQGPDLLHENTVQELEHNKVMQAVELARAGQ